MYIHLQMSIVVYRTILTLNKEAFETSVNQLGLKHRIDLYKERLRWIPSKIPPALRRLLRPLQVCWKF